MSKRIKALASLAYETGRLDSERMSAVHDMDRYSAIQKRSHEALIACNAARDALEVDITTVLTSLKAALELVHHDADTPRLHRAIDMLEVAAAIMEGRDPSPWQELLAEDDY